MESIGYVVTNKFILIAVDTNIELTVDGQTFATDNAKKVHRINDQVLFSIVGDLHKTTGIRIYLEALNRSRPNESFDEIADNIVSTFNISAVPDVEAFRKTIYNKIRLSVDENDILDSDRLKTLLGDNPDLLALTEDGLKLMSSGLKHPTHIFLFGTDKNPLALRTSKHLLVGNSLVSQEMLPIGKDYIQMEFISSTSTSKENTQISDDLRQELQAYQKPGWEDSPELTNVLMQAAKALLTKGIIQQTPFTSVPNVVFYEISADTNFSLLEPSVFLETITFNRPS